ncbi:TPA: hypothetical protein DEX28_01430 [Patescibacteria group bacterium]|nr:hypothetical protein [Patescibacteria group bacterium]
MPLPPAPGGATLSTDSIDSLFTYVYNFALGLGGLLAFFRLVYAGILWGSEGSGIAQKANAMDVIKNSIFGLLLLLFSWVILNTINPQILNLNLSVSKTDTTRTKTFAGVFDSLVSSNQRQSLDEVLKHISRTYLIQTKPDKIINLTGPDYEIEQKPICLQIGSGIQPVCAMNCTTANEPCDFYAAKCAGELELPSNCIPADPECKSADGTRVDVCTLVGDWQPGFPDYQCSNYARPSIDPSLPGNEAYKPYLKQAAAYFGVDPKILAAIMVIESEELVPKLLPASEVQQAASPGGYIKGVTQGINSSRGGKIEDWCKPNSAGAVGHMQITIKSCNQTGVAQERCNWDEYCKFRFAANQVRNDNGYKPNPSNVLDGFAIVAKKARFLMDGGHGFPGMLNDILGYKFAFSRCPGKVEMLKWEPPKGIFNPIVFYVIGHFYYGNSIEEAPTGGALLPRLLDSAQLEIDVSGLGKWMSDNEEKILTVRAVFADRLQKSGLGDFEYTTKITAPTYGDFLWWYYDTH